MDLLQVPVGSCSATSFGFFVCFLTEQSIVSIDNYMSIICVTKASGSMIHACVPLQFVSTEYRSSIILICE